MCDEWMPNITLPLTAAQYEQLPRNAAYQYDYLHGAALLSPRPKHFHGILDFAKRQAPDPVQLSAAVQVRPMSLEDQVILPEVFAAAFEGVQPFGGLAREQRLTASRQVLTNTWQGGGGPLVRQASFTAVHADQKTPLGAIMITLVPGGAPGRAESYRWQEPPPRVWHNHPLAQPHLTWIFVAPRWKAGGVGSALLEAAVTSLNQLGHGSLWTTFLMGNDASVLWHWRNGFSLAPYPLSRRVLRREMKGNQ
jgi:hypothetical protein